MNKRGIVPLVILLIALVVIIGGYYAVNKSLSIYDSGTFAKPLWARLECSAEDYQTDYTTYLSQQTLFKCNFNTQQCNFQISGDPNSRSILLGGRVLYYQICDANGLNCGSSTQFDLADGQVISLPSLNNGQSMKFSKTTLDVTNPFATTKVTQKYYLFKLFRYYGGAKDIVNSYDCSIQSGDLSKIRTQDYTTNTLSRTGGVGTKWINYVDDWAYGPATNIYTWNGKQVYCTNAKVYSIVQIQMKDGSLVKLAPTYSGTLADGSKLYGLGDLLSSVECCPQEPNCGVDFKYKPVTPENPNPSPVSCFSDLQCYNAGGNTPIDATHYVKYQCVSGQCKATAPIQIECTTNAQCANGQICDLSTMNYGKCITPKQGEYCGDDICQITESGNPKSPYYCQADCKTQCPEGQTLKITYSQTFWSIIGVSQPTKTEQCVSFNFWDAYGLYIVVALAVILLLFTIFYLKSVKLALIITIAFVLYIAFAYLGSTITIFLLIAGALIFIIFAFKLWRFII